MVKRLLRYKISQNKFRKNRNRILPCKTQCISFSIFTKFVLRYVITVQSFYHHFFTVFLFRSSAASFLENVSQRVDFSKTNVR